MIDLPSILCCVSPSVELLEPTIPRFSKQIDASGPIHVCELANSRPYNRVGLLSNGTCIRPPNIWRSSLVL